MSEPNAAPIAFVDPPAPDMRPIQELHRGNDGYIAFTRRNALGQFQTLFSVKASDLGGLFGGLIAPHIDADGFFSVNAFYRPGYGRSEVEPRLKAARWRTTEARWLTACYVDFDFYAKGMTIGQAIGVVVDAQERGIIPPASMLTRSGRGLWAWWFLRDERLPDMPARAAVGNVVAYQRIERQLIRLFASIEPDRGARDVARVTRVPGSINSKAGVRVGYWIQRDQDAKPFTYTLNQMAAWLKVPPPNLPAGFRKAIDPAASAKGKRGYAALWEQRFDRIVKLLTIRGKAPEGTRNRTLYVLALCSRKHKMSEAETREVVMNVAEHQCDPPLSYVDAIETMKAAKQCKAISDQTIADWLKVTPDEAQQIGGRYAGQEEVPPPMSRTDRQRNRRELIRYLCAGRTSSNMPTVRELAQFIEERTGERPSLRTISGDMDAVGIVNPRRRRKDDTGPDLLAIES